MKGCHNPISMLWRSKAELIVFKAETLVEVRIVGVTWYMAKMLISFNKSFFQSMVSYVDAPEVQVVYPDETNVSGHVWDDPETGIKDKQFIKGR